VTLELAVAGDVIDTIFLQCAHVRGRAHDVRDRTLGGTLAYGASGEGQDDSA